MSDFLSKIRNRQKMKRDGYPQDKWKQIPRIRTQAGYLLNENGETDQYVRREQVYSYFENVNVMRNTHSREVQIHSITQKIDNGDFGPIFPVSMLNYYLDVPTLTPIGG